MPKLTCSHKRRVMVMPLSVIHRNDGSACDSRTVSNVKTMTIRQFRKANGGIAK